MQSIVGSAACLKISRVMRLIALRVTALGASRFATTTPRRACSRLLGRTYKTKWLLLYAGRKRKTDEKSSVFTIRLRLS